MTERRTAANLIRFHPAELARIAKRARACGHTPARLIRETVLGAIPKARQHVDAETLLHTADVTLAEAARQLMLPKELGHQLDLESHVIWLHGRLLKRRNDLVNLFDDADADSGAVDRAIEALTQLHQEWPEEKDGYDFAAHGEGQPM